MKEITKDMTINQALMVDRGLVGVFQEIGMHCVGCPSAQMETLEEAAMVHGMTTEQLMDKINAYLGK